MAPEDACSADMLVVIHWQDRTMAVPLSQLAAVDPDDSTAEAIADWHYWVAQGTVNKLHREFVAGCVNRRAQDSVSEFLIHVARGDARSALALCLSRRETEVGPDNRIDFLGAQIARHKD